jgi:hypothetical protein
LHVCSIHLPVWLELSVHAVLVFGRAARVAHCRRAIANGAACHSVSASSHRQQGTDQHRQTPHLASPAGTDNGMIAALER